MWQMMLVVAGVAVTSSLCTNLSNFVAAQVKYDCSHLSHYTHRRQVDVGRVVGPTWIEIRTIRLSHLQQRNCDPSRQLILVWDELVAVVVVKNVADDSHVDRRQSSAAVIAAVDAVVTQHAVLQFHFAVRE